MKITLTGIDEKTDLDALPEGCELGFLYTYDPENRPRYPRHEPMYKMIESLKDRDISIHVCGKRARDQLILGYIKHTFYAKRIQVNGTLSEKEVGIICNKYPSYQIIVQYNSKNKHLIDIKYDNLQFLMDSSGGQGITPNAWSRAETVQPVGYAGGIGPDNIEQIYKIAIRLSSSSICLDQNDDWLDMENKLRTDDWFDVNKANEVMEKFNKVNNVTRS